MIRIAMAFDAPIGELLGVPDMSADSIEAARLLSVLPAEVREPLVTALRALAKVVRGRAPQGFASPSPRPAHRRRGGGGAGLRA
jgi:hypothetical protein